LRSINAFLIALFILMVSIAIKKFIFGGKSWIMN
jgi:hypothetical protein